MLVTNPSNKYFKYHEITHQLELKNEDRSTPFIAINNLGYWNIRRKRRILLYKTYEEKIETISPAIYLVKKDKIYSKLFSSSSIQGNINEYIKSLYPKNHFHLDDDKFLEYLKYSFLADISYIYGLYINDIEIEKNNIDTHGLIRKDCHSRLNKSITKIQQLIKENDNPVNNYFTKDFKSTLKHELFILEFKKRDLKTIVNRKENYSARMLIARLGHYIFDNYGTIGINHNSLVESLATNIGAGGANSISSDTFRNVAKDIKSLKTYKRVPKLIRYNIWDGGKHALRWYEEHQGFYTPTSLIKANLT